ncbi:MAG TPA: hypothetical protein VFJ19_03645 [Nocardioidaceae bacterium]|nr:hypothetical protein [Nocardioidaceae bacterium]
MKPRVALSLGLWALIIAAACLATVLGPHRGVGEIFVLVMFQAFPAVGVLLVVRQPGNPIGPIFMLTGALAAIQGLSEAVVDRALASHDLAGIVVRTAAWAQSWMWLPALAVPLVFGTLLLPDGRPFSSFFRRVTVAATVTVGGTVLLYAAAALTTPTAELVDKAGSEQAQGGERVFFAAISVLVAGTLVCALLGVVSLALRYRRGSEQVRQQLKAVLLSAGLAVACVVAGSFTDDLQNTLEPVGIALLALGVGLAILRYRLYDLDRIVSRTVSYALVTGALIGVYIGCVALLTDVLPFAGTVGSAASVLVAVALFAPLRRRVQSVVDRRFNRARYDAETTVAAFASRLRDQVELDAVRRDLVAVVRGTVAPSHVSVWMRSVR